MNGPRRRDINTNNGMNGARFDNMRKSFFVVNTMLLREYSTDPSSFIAREGTIGVKLLSINPFARNNIGIMRRRNELPCLIGK
jgi:hypothetical protein